MHEKGSYKGLVSEFEARIEGHSQYTGVPFQGQYGVAQSDLGMDVRLRKLRGK